MLFLLFRKGDIFRYPTQSCQAPGPTLSLVLLHTPVAMPIINVPFFLLIPVLTSHSTGHGVGPERGAAS